MKGHEAEGIQHGRLSLLAAGQAFIMAVSHFNWSATKMIQCGPEYFFFFTFAFGRIIN